MSTSALSPVTPARVRALLVPVGKITRQRFDALTSRLYPESNVRLSDISPDGRPDRNMFSPMAFPSGVILYNLTTEVVPESHAALSPFEVFRGTLAVVGIADAETNGTDADSLAAVNETMSIIRSNMPDLLLTHVFLFDADDSLKVPDDMSVIPPKTHARQTHIKTAMCDMSARFLSELVLLARTIQNQRIIEVPEILHPSGRSQQSADVTAYVSRPASSSSHTDGASPDVFARSMNSLPSVLSNLPEESPDTPEVSRPQSPTSDLQSPPRNRPQSPDDWEGTVGSRRPMSSGGLPSQIKSASAPDRARNKMKGRQSVIIGSLYLMAGRWPDALRELTDGATRARAFGDHSYHAKGMENILITMLLLTWAGSDFTIPSICYATEKTKNRSSGTLNTLPPETRPSNEIQARSLVLLSAMLPEFITHICITMSRPITIYGQSMPQLPLSETIVRLSYLYAVLHRVGGVLNLHAIQSIVIDARAARTFQESKASTINKREVSALLFRAYPPLPPDSTQSMFDASIILSQMSSVLSFLGLNRKRAVLIKEMLSMMIPGLIQARKVGAAEVGIHPAASLAALHGLSQDTPGYSSVATDSDAEKGLRSVMLQLCQAYGIGIRDWTTESLSNWNGAPLPDLPSRDTEDLIMKLEVLRLCMNFSEALPNFRDVMWFASNMLKIASPPSLPPVANGVGKVGVGVDEQVRLGTKIYRMLGVVKSADVELLSTLYWDPFMVRGIELSEPDGNRRMSKHKIADFLPSSKHNRQQSSVSRKGPFIHDASKVPKQPVDVQQVTAANQKSEFWVQLQNPFDFDVIIESIELLTEGVTFSQRSQSTVIGPSRIQRTLVSGVAEEVGTLVVRGCRVKIQGCKEQDFEIFEDSWISKPDLKVKTRGLQTRPRHQTHDPSPSTSGIEAQQLPKSRTVEIVVVESQANCILASSSLSQSMMTILEGERQTFSLTIHNTSEAIPVNFVHLSFEHSLLDAAASELRGVAGQIHAFELLEASTSRPPFKWKFEPDSNLINIPPGGRKTFDIEVNGVFGLTEGLVHVDYATSVPSAATTSNAPFYTRRVSLPFAVTVNPSLELQRFHILSLAKGSSAPRAATPDDAAAALITQLNSVSSRFDSFILLLDLRNSLSRPLRALIDVQNPDASTAAPLVSLDEIVPAQQIKRVAVPVPRLHVPNPTRPLSTVEGTQYVVSSEEPDAGARKAQAELLTQFWYKQALLALVRGRWRELDARKPRHGALDLTRLNLTPELVTRVKVADVQVGLRVLADAEDDVWPPGAEPHHVAHVPVQSPRRLVARVRNRTERKVTLHVRLVPGVAEHASAAGTGGAGWDVARRVAWTGMFERRLCEVKPDETREMVWGFAGLSSGQYEFQLSVRTAAEEGQGTGERLAGMATIEVNVDDDEEEDESLEDED